LILLNAKFIFCDFCLPCGMFTPWNVKLIPLGRLFVYPVKAPLRLFNRGGFINLKNRVNGVSRRGIADEARVDLAHFIQIVPQPRFTEKMQDPFGTAVLSKSAS